MDIDKTGELVLREYPFKPITSASYTDLTIRAKLIMDPAWFCNATNPSAVGHFTLLEATLAHNQLAYLLVACALQTGELGLPRITLEDINAMKFKRMLLTNFSIHFNHDFNSRDEFDAMLSMQPDHKPGENLWLNMVFDFEKDHASGTSKGVILGANVKSMAQVK